MYSQNNSKMQYKYPYILFCVYLTCLLTTVCLANRLTLFGNLLLPGGIFLFTLTFPICDVVGEVYGYAYPRLFIWMGIFAEFLFSLTVICVSNLKAPFDFTLVEAYQSVFNPTFRYVLSGLVALLIGEFTNIYFLTKWKIIFKGKLFIIRSLLSAAFGQALLTIIVDILNYFEKLNLNDLIWMMVSGYSWKMFFSLLFVFPSWFLVRYLKEVENIDHFDINTNFNPFIFSLNSEKI